MSERRWRSAANRPSRQARRGWASLYEAPSQKKNHLPRATKIQQPKNFLPRINPLTTTSPCSPEPTMARSQAFSGQARANLGQKWAILGRFWVDFGLSRAKIAPFLPPIPPPGEPPSSPGDVQKLHLPLSACGRILFILIFQNHTNYRIFVTFTSKNAPLSL